MLLLLCILSKQSERGSLEKKMPINTLEIESNGDGNYVLKNPLDSSENFIDNKNIINVRTEGISSTPSKYFMSSSIRYFHSDATLVTIEERAFENCIELCEVTIGSVTSIGGSAFLNCQSLQHITLDYDCTIGLSSFTNCINLISFSCQNINIQALSFFNCYSLQTFDFTKINGNIYESSFANCTSITEVETKATTIRTKAFQNCISLTKFSATSDQITINNEAFSNCSLVSFNAKSATLGQNCFSYNNFITINTTNWTFNLYTSGVFSYCENLETAYINHNTIPYNFFSGCITLRQVTLAKPNTYIYNDAFNSCIKLNEIININYIAYLYAKAFYNCTSLTEFSFNEAITRIPSHAFTNRENLQTVNMVNTITTIEEFAFANCFSIQTFSFANSVEAIEQNAFENCTNLQSITLSNALTSIGKSVFANCKILSSINLPSSITKISSKQFLNCSALINIPFIQNIQILEEEAFANCISLTSIIFPAQINSIPNKCFSGCSLLEKIIFEANNVTINSEAFYQCTSLKILQFPSEEVTIYNDAFYGIAITSFNYNGNLISKGRLFAGCNLLTEINLRKCTMTSTPFSDNAELQKISFDIVEEIPMHAFIRCPKLAELVILNENEQVKIYEMSFSGSQLRNITICSKIIPDNNYAEKDSFSLFNGCNDLSILNINEFVSDSKVTIQAENLEYLTIRKFVSVESDSFYAESTLK